jgi:hypothetical protein
LARVRASAIGGAHGTRRCEHTARRPVGLLTPATVLPARLREHRAVVSDLPATGHGAFGHDGVGVLEDRRQSARRDADARLGE